MKKKLIYLIILIFANSSIILGEKKNYKKLEEIEKKLQYNELTYKELIKIEKELSKDLNKVKKNINKYKKLISRGFSEKQYLEKIISNDMNKLKALKLKIDYYKYKKGLIINNVIFLHYTGEEKTIHNKIALNIINNINADNKLKKMNYIELEKNIEAKNLYLKRLNKSLKNIELSLNTRSNELEGLIGETIITAIQKQENKIQKNKFKEKANEIKSLIREFENNKKNSKPFESFKFSELKDILPIRKFSIKSIKIDTFDTGVLIHLKKSTSLIAPKNSLVVYADFFKGYGKMIILDLGNDYHLIFSGLSNIACKTGDWIEKGGVLGDISRNDKKEVYMEFRFKGKTINPSRWVRS